jgi:hypothetical protein
MTRKKWNIGYWNNGTRGDKIIKIFGGVLWY